MVGLKVESSCGNLLATVLDVDSCVCRNFDPNGFPGLFSHCVSYDCHVVANLALAESF